MTRAALVLAALAAVLVGCAKAPPVPLDHFYRLPLPERAGSTSGADGTARPEEGWLGSVISVAPFRSDGLHQERALIYTDDAAALALKRYHYHHWVDSPTRLLQEALALRLREAGAGRLVLTTRDARPDATVSGRIVALHHHLVPGGPARALVGLEIEVRRRGAPNPIWLGRYRAEEAIPEPGMLGTVAAFGRSVDRAIAEFIGDLRRDLSAGVSPGAGTSRASR